jgi:NMD protein affecting ribosome stability and mRNA decay
MKHCPICNRSSDEARFFGQFCEYCIKDMIMQKLPKEIIIEKCKRCNKIRTADGFMEKNKKSLENAINRQIRGYTFRIKKMEEDKVSGTVKEIIGGDHVTADIEFGLKYEKKLCPQCYLISGEYYEGIIQLRGTKREIDIRMASIMNFFEKNDSFIMKLVDNDGGVDMYVGSKKLANEYMLIHKLKPIMSYTPAGLRRGRKVFRNTYALHL